MAYLAPFRALRYNPTRTDLSQVVTQPYDKITPEMQERYYVASPFNLVRVILGKRIPSDHSGDNPYTRAAHFLEDWRSQGILRRDDEPSIYSYIQHFTAPGESTQRARKGFIALGKVEDYSARVVFRHEQTLAKPKADRLELLRATRAHFGQLFMLYSDPPGEVDRLLDTPSSPDIDVCDEYGVRHVVRKVSDPGLIEQVRVKMREKQLLIADGHHRYETALNYRDECRALASTRDATGPQQPSRSDPQRQASTEIPPYELVMMTFINMDSPGLAILPTHRVVYGLAGFSPQSLHDRARQYFSVEEVDPAITPARAVGILREAGHSGTALLAVTADRAFLFDTAKTIGSSFFGNLSLRQQWLDVVQLHKCLLEGVLGISEEAIREQQNIRYIRDSGEAMVHVREGKADVAFLMNPVKMRDVRDIAFAGEVLPQKSTDFYPKLLSGLTIYPLDPK